MRVGVVHWQRGDELAALIANTLEGLNQEVVEMASNASVPPGVDVVLALGPFGSLMPLARQLLAQAVPARPSLVLWMTEQLWNPRLPACVGRAIGELRSCAERFALRGTPSSDGHARPRWRWLTTRGLRFRYYGDLHWLRRQGLLTVLAVPSQWMVGFLGARGFDATLAYIGSHPQWRAAAAGERDVPALWLGTTGSRRRGRLLRRLREELRDRGVELRVIDGVEHPPVFGLERARLLSRTKVVVNLLRKPWDSNSLRFYLAAPNGAMMVTEPTLAHNPCVAGVHLVQAPPEQMADTICHYLTHEDARRRIAERAYELVTTELTMANGVARIMERVARARQSGGLW
jgi:hypothetical protein